MMQPAACETRVTMVASANVFIGSSSLGQVAALDAAATSCFTHAAIGAPAHAERDPSLRGGRTCVAISAADAGSSIRLGAHVRGIAALRHRHHQLDGAQAHRLSAYHPACLLYTSPSPRDS